MTPAERIAVARALIAPLVGYTAVPEVCGAPLRYAVGGAK